MNPLTAPLNSNRNDALKLVAHLQASRDSILRNWRAGINMLWQHNDPQGVLDALAEEGIRADQMFAESAALGQYLAGVAARSQDAAFAAQLQAALAPVLPVTFSPETGAGTIQFPPPNEPEPSPENPS